MEVRYGRDEQGPGAGCWEEAGSQFLGKLLEVSSHSTLLYLLIYLTLSFYIILFVNLSL